LARRTASRRRRWIWRGVDLLGIWE
jgi:hypothetical protein